MLRTEFRDEVRQIWMMLDGFTLNGNNGGGQPNMARAGEVAQGAHVRNQNPIIPRDQQIAMAIPTKEIW